LTEGLHKIFIRKDLILNRVWLFPALFLLIFPGIALSQKVRVKGDSIKIGLLISDKHSLAAERGAWLAIAMANRNNNVKSQPFKLIVRSMEGPWGTGSTQAVNLVFDEKVVALLGSHDGRNAHLVEQVAAKSRVVFVSAWSADPTLAQAFVPWFFNCVPDDAKQAEAITDEIYRKKKFSNPVIISDENYESKSSLKNLLRKINDAGYQSPLLISWNENGQNIENLKSQIHNTRPDCIILFLKQGLTPKAMADLGINKPGMPVYCTLVQLEEDNLTVQDMSNLDGGRFVCSADLYSPSGKKFASEFRKLYGCDPGAVAAYSYDAMNLLIRAIQTGGTEREGMQKALRETKYEGVTGLIQFDERGSRKGVPGFVTVKNGIHVLVK
jgi:branched-chain amino acid transport system substrate-binding protein